MTRPDRLRTMAGATWRHMRNAPRRFVAMTVSQSSGFIRRIRPSRVIPALFTRMSIAPCRSRIPFTAVSTEAGSATSIATPSAPRPIASASR